MMKLNRLLLLLTFLFSAPAWSFDYNDRNSSARALAMGGAFTALVDNSDALFVNPAALANMSGMTWTILDPRAGLSGTQETLDIISNLTEDIAATLNSLMGTPLWASAGAKSAVVFPYFGLGVYNSYNLLLEATNPVFPELKINSVNDMGYVAGFAFPFIPKVFYMGMTIKRFTRTGAIADVSGASVTDQEFINNLLSQKGVAWSMDLGMNLTIPSPVFTPTLAFVWRDVGKTTFSAPTGSSLPRDEDNMIFSAAFAIATPVVDITPVVELRYLNNSSVQFAQKLHLGLELSLPLLDIRGGFYQGYWSAGAGLSLGVIELDVATWGAELGEYPGQKEDRRYMLQLTIELGIGGLDFLTGGSGEDGGVQRNSARHRRLKQRR